MTRTTRKPGADVRPAVLPDFPTVVGRMPLEEIDTDLVLVPVLCGHKVPRSLYAKDPAAAEAVQRSIEENNFHGRRGTHLLVKLPAEPGQKRPHVLLVGLGRPQCFTAVTATEVFRLVAQEAIALGAKSVTIPFLPNRSTGECLKFKPMAFRLKEAVAHVVREAGSRGALEEVKILCSAQARRHIHQGLALSVEATQDAPEASEAEGDTAEDFCCNAARA